MKKHHYVYKSYEIAGREYIGIRSCNCLPEEDTKYFGSFSDKTFNPSEKTILFTGETREEVAEIEVELHDFFDVGVNPQFANKAKQTSSGFYCSELTISHRQAISESNRRRRVSTETREKISKSQREVSKSPEVKKRRSDAAKNKPPVKSETRLKLKEAQNRLKGDKELQKRKGRPGRPQSESHRENRAKAQTGVQLTESRKQKISEGLKRYHAEQKRKNT